MIFLVLPEIQAEDELLARARRGAQAAIMEIYELYFPPVYGFLRLRLGDPAQAEDLASEVFLKLVASIRRGSAPRHSLRGWLFRVARNELHHHYGRENRLPTVTLDDWEPVADDADLESTFIRSMNRDRARHAIRMLAADQQEVLVLRFGQRLNLDETADVMGKSVAAIKSLQFRAISTLRRLLAEMSVEPSHD